MNLENLKCVELELQDQKEINGGYDLFSAAVNLWTGAAQVALIGLSGAYHSLNPHYGK